MAHARQLWALADRLQAENVARLVDAEQAAASWRGKYGDDFRARVAGEQADVRRVVGGLRAEAQAWATAWRDAMNEQNRRNRAAQVHAVSARRSWAERNVGDLFLGDDSGAQVPGAPVATTPTAPAFTPTCAEVRY